MKKQWRMVIISGGVLVALILALVLGGLLKKPAETTETTTTAPAAEAVFKTTADLIKTVEFSSPNGTLRIFPKKVTDPEGKVSYGWTVDGSGDYPLDNNAVSSLGSLATLVYASAEIATGVTDLAPYGLDQPEATMTVTMLTGERHVVKFGKEIVSGYYDYVSLDGTGRICKVASTTCDRAKQTLVDLLDKNAVVGIKYSDLTALAFERARDQLKIEMTCELVGEADTEQAYLDIKVTEPIKRSGSSEKLNRLCQESCAIVAENYVELNPQDLSKYGLDNPRYTLTLGTAGKSVTVRIGSQTGTSIYAISSVLPAVFKIASSSFTVIDMPVLEMLDRFVNLYSIWDVSKIEGNVFGTRFISEISMTKDQRADDEGVVFTLDGENARIFSEKDASLYSKFYQRLISPLIAGLEIGAAPVNGHEASLVFHMKADTANNKPARTELIEFTKRDDYTYYVFINNVYTGFYVDYIRTFTETKTDDEGIIAAYKKLKYAMANAVDGVFDTSKGYQLD